MSADYDVVVIGAGLGGLAAASLLAQRGRRVMVIDRHNVPGGYASNFQRKGFHFDVSLHSFDGAVEGADSFECIRACGVADKVEFLPHKRLYRYIGADLDFSVADRDIDAYKAQLASLFPGEAGNLERLFAEAGRTYDNVAGFLYSSLPFWLRLLATPFLYHRVLRYENHTVDRFFSRYTDNAALKAVLAAQWTYYGLPPREMAFPYFSYPFMDYLRNGGFSIKGGSQRLSDALREVIEAHGGCVLLSSPVTAIHLDGKRIAGVTSRKSGRVFAPTVIANVSPHAVTQLAGTSNFPEKFLRRLHAARVSTSAIQVYLGLDCSLQSLGIDPDEYVIFKAGNPDISAQFAEMTAGRIEGPSTGFSLNFFSNVDPGMAPPGKASLGIFSLLGNTGWDNLSRTEYRQKKEALVDALIAKAALLMPGLREHIAVCEAGTPRTLNKFTANPLGAIYGFEQNIRQSGLLRRFRQRYPIRGLYQVGAWTFPGAGFIGALLSARVLVDRYFSPRVRTRPAVSMPAPATTASAAATTATTATTATITTQYRPQPNLQDKRT